MTKEFYKSRLFWVGLAGAVYYALQLAGVEVLAPSGDLKEFMDLGYALIVLFLRFRTDQGIKLAL